MGGWPGGWLEKVKIEQSSASAGFKLAELGKGIFDQTNIKYNNTKFWVQAKFIHSRKSLDLGNCIISLKGNLDNLIEQD